jgi:hypothetical protein
MKNNDTPYTVEDITMARALAGRALDDISTVAEREVEQLPEATKHELPHRSGEPRFAPRAYYYAASRSGVVPSWVASAH